MQRLPVLNRRLGVGVGLLVVMVAAWLALRSGRGDRPPAAGRPGSGAGGAQEDERGVRGEAGGSSGAAASPTEARLQAALDQYRRDAVYPPWSRPLDEGTDYKLAWNQPIISELPWLESGGKRLAYRFGADRHHVTFGEPLTTWIEIYPVDQPEARVPLQVIQSYVLAVSGAKQGRSVKLAYRDDGREGDAVAGDHRYSNRFTPSAHEELAGGEQVIIFAEVEAEGLRKPMQRDFTYAARPVLEVLAVRDAVEGGSLVLTVDCQVHEAGLFTFEANLLTATAEPVPIAYLDQSFPLEPGKQTVKLTFFGKVIVDKGFAGPYLVRDLRGFERDLDGIEANQWWSWPHEHRTRAYRLDELSPAEWDAPEKREKIAGLEQLIEETRAGKIGGAGESPTIIVGEDGVERPAP